MAEAIDPLEMPARFRSRADAVKERIVPPIEGAARQDFIRQARADFQDYAMLADAEATMDGGILILKVDLRPTSVPEQA